jgi:hypothetical protein
LVVIWSIVGPTGALLGAVTGFIGSVNVAVAVKSRRWT